VAAHFSTLSSTGSRPAMRSPKLCRALPEPPWLEPALRGSLPFFAIGYRLSRPGAVQHEETHHDRCQNPACSVLSLIIHALQGCYVRQLVRERKSFNLRLVLEARLSSPFLYQTSAMNYQLPALFCFTGQYTPLRFAVNGERGPAGLSFSSTAIHRFLAPSPVLEPEEGARGGRGENHLIVKSGEIEHRSVGHLWPVRYG
jgi:hypothetical protein